MGCSLCAMLHCLQPHAPAAGTPAHRHTAGPAFEGSVSYDLPPERQTTMQQTAASSGQTLRQLAGLAVGEAPTHRRQASICRSGAAASSGWRAWGRPQQPAATATARAAAAAVAVQQGAVGAVPPPGRQRGGGAGGSSGCQLRGQCWQGCCNGCCSLSGHAAMRPPALLPAGGGRRRRRAAALLRH